MAWDDHFYHGDMGEPDPCLLHAQDCWCGEDRGSEQCKCEIKK